mgnify:CR=1 FL=1
MTEIDDLFELKYLEEISQLFNRLKGMDNYYNLHLNLNDKNFIHLFDFINNHVIIYDNIDEQIYEEIDDENKYNNNIYGKF